jgi:L-iditol 2-dehydrogenase
MSTVKAAVFLGKESIEIREFPKPEVASDCALLKIAACGICGTDPHIYMGHLNVPAPLVLGHEFSGIVEEMGKDFPREDMLGRPLKLGDRVSIGTTMNCGKCYYCRFTPHRNNLCTNCDIYGITMGIGKPPALFGGYSEYVYLLPGSWLFKIEDGMSFEEAALADPCACATRTVERAFLPGMPGSNDSMGSGKSVVVQGLGTIGLLAAADAKACGAYPVIGIEGNVSRLKLAKKFGVDYVIDINEHKTAEERVVKVRELTLGLGADVVLEMAGVPAVFAEAIQLVRAGGKVVEFGHFSNVGTVPINPQDIVNKDLDIHGVFAYPNTQINIALRLLQYTKDRFPYKELITHRFDVEHAEDAVKAGRDKTCVKAMIVNPV